MLSQRSGSRISQFALLVKDYDEAIAFFVGKLGFELLEDSDLGDDKRWVRVAPRGNGRGGALLLARAVGEEQEKAVGRQAGGRVFSFLETDDFDRDHERFDRLGVKFVREPRSEPYGKVAVFQDVSGNHWDLIQPASRSTAAARGPGRRKAVRAIASISWVTWALSAIGGGVTTASYFGVLQDRGKIELSECLWKNRDCSPTSDGGRKFLEEYFYLGGKPDQADMQADAIILATSVGLFGGRVYPGAPVVVRYKDQSFSRILAHVEDVDAWAKDDRGVRAFGIVLLVVPILLNGILLVYKRLVGEAEGA